MREYNGDRQVSQRQWVRMGLRKRLGFLTGVKAKEMYGYVEDGTERGKSGDN